MQVEGFEDTDSLHDLRFSGIQFLSTLFSGVVFFVAVLVLPSCGMHSRASPRGYGKESRPHSAASGARAPDFHLRGFSVPRSTSIFGSLLVPNASVARTYVPNQVPLVQETTDSTTLLTVSTRTEILLSPNAHIQIWLHLLWCVLPSLANGDVKLESASLDEGLSEAMVLVTGLEREERERESCIQYPYSAALKTSALVGFYIRPHSHVEPLEHTRCSVVCERLWRTDTLPDVVGRTGLARAHDTDHVHDLFRRPKFGCRVVLRLLEHYPKGAIVGIIDGLELYNLSYVG